MKVIRQVCSYKRPNLGLGKVSWPKSRSIAKISGVLTQFIFASILFCPPPCNAAEETSYHSVSTPRFTLFVESTGEGKDTRSKDIASTAIKILNDNYEEFSRIFKADLNKKVVLKFLSPKEFHRQTGAPPWTSAMYYRGEITVPIPLNGPVSSKKLRRALRHEYIHAVIAELSDNKAPAWLDEGIAQLIEGTPNPLLGPALREWIRYDNPMPLSWLENGFTTLEDSVVPAAYAQSLFAVRTLVNSNGFPAITKYLQLLAKREKSELAFATAFGKPQKEFETRLGPMIGRWAKSQNRHP